jgi:sulfate adenylyltransferase subunit 1 (EFTu-like GTPase family)
MPVEEIKESFNKLVDRFNVSESGVLPISALTG